MRYLAMAGTLALVFLAWFSFGYYQPVNPDSYIEYTAVAFEPRVPWNLISDYWHRSRWFADIIGFATIHTLGPIWSILNIPISKAPALSQGIMMGLEGLWFGMIGGYYACELKFHASLKYILSVILITGLLLASDTLIWIDHLSVFNHYFATSALLLTVLAAYWRWWLTGALSTHTSPGRKIVWYLGLLLLAFSSSGTTIFCLLFAPALGACLIYRRRPPELFAPLLFLFCASLIALTFERGSGQGRGMERDLSELLIYARAWLDWWVLEFDPVDYWGGGVAPALKNTIIILIVAVTYGLTTFVGKHHQPFNYSTPRANQGFLFVFLTILVYSFVVGFTRVSYARFAGWNIGEDTFFIFYAWSLVFVVHHLVGHRQFKIMQFIIPVILFICLSHILWFMAATDGNLKATTREQQAGFRLMEQIDSKLDDGSLVLPECYERALSRWGDNHHPLAQFAYRVGITSRVYTISFVPYGEFRRHYEKLAVPVPNIDNCRNQAVSNANLPHPPIRPR